MKLIPCLASVSNAVADKPFAVLLPSVTLSGALTQMYHLVINDVVWWFVPCLFVIIADLFTGVRAAHARNERVTGSAVIRRTLSKIVAYLSWTIFAVIIGYKCEWVELTMGTMLLIMFIEGASCIANIVKRNGDNPLDSSTGRQIAAIIISRIFRINVSADELRGRGCGNGTTINNPDTNQKMKPTYGNNQENSKENR